MKRSSHINPSLKAGVMKINRRRGFSPDQRKYEASSSFPFSLLPLRCAQRRNDVEKGRCSIAKPDILFYHIIYSPMSNMEIRMIRTFDFGKDQQPGLSFGERGLDVFSDIK